MLWAAMREPSRISTLHGVMVREATPNCSPLEFSPCALPRARFRHRSPTIFSFALSDLRAQRVVRRGGSEPAARTPSLGVEARGSSEAPTFARTPSCREDPACWLLRLWACSPLRSGFCSLWLRLGRYRVEFHTPGHHPKPTKAFSPDPN